MALERTLLNLLYSGSLMPVLLIRSSTWGSGDTLPVSLIAACILFSPDLVGSARKSALTTGAQTILNVVLLGSVVLLVVHTDHPRLSTVMTLHSSGRRNASVVGASNTDGRAFSALMSALPGL